jgi:large repetitive protein
VADGQGIATITDNDPAPTIAVGNITVVEGTGGTTTASFPVTLSAPSGFTVTVSFVTANGTAVAPGDYTTTSGTVTFAPGTTTANANVPVVGDSTNEPSETFVVNLSSPTNATIADTQGVATITDNDPVTLAINNVSLTEANGGTQNMIFTVTKTGATVQTVTVNYATADATAVQPGDYSARSGTLTFSAATTTQTITVPVVGDQFDENDETFVVNLSGATVATIIDNQGVGTIADNDATPSLDITNVSITEGNTGTANLAFTIELSAVSGRTVTVVYATANGTATAPADYTATSGTLTFNPGTTSLSVNVPVVGDTLDEANETFVFNLSNAVNATIADTQATGTITDNDAPPSLAIANNGLTEGNTGTTPLVFTVTLSAASGQVVTVNYSTAAGSASAPADYTTTSGVLTFPAGTTSQTISVPVVGDTMDEPNETFVVNLTGASNATIADTQATGTITDNDTAPAITVNNVSVTESTLFSSTMTFTVSLSNASSQTVTVNFATANGTAIAGNDYTARNGTLTFNPGTTTQTVAVTITGDFTRESSETLFLNLSGASATATIADAQGVGTIIDND